METYGKHMEISGYQQLFVSFVQQKKEIQTGLNQHQGADMMTDYSVLGELSL